MIEMVAKMLPESRALSRQTCFATKEPGIFGIMECPFYLTSFGSIVDAVGDFYGVLFLERSDPFSDCFRSPFELVTGPIQGSSRAE